MNSTISSQLTAHSQSYSLISVIVPVYNVEKYLDRCISSIVNQTYRNLEIILVDDGSKDNSPAMCDEWMKRDERIRVFHQENKGQAAARNVGLDMAKGSLIGFIDSDDSIKPEMYQRLYELMTENNADLSMCELYRFDEENKEFILPLFANEILTGEQAVEYMIMPNHAGSYVNPVNKLYKAKLFENLRFNEGYIHEDEYIMPHIFGACKKIVTSSEQLYLRLMHKESTMGRISSVNFYYKSFIGYLYAYTDRHEYLMSTGKKGLADYVLRNTARHLYQAFRNINYLQHRQELSIPTYYTLKNMILSDNFGTKLRGIKLILLWLRSLFRPYIRESE